MISPRLPLITAILAVLLAIALAALTYRQGRMLTFDGYFYCEQAKQFAVEWPDRFGNHWPFGYALLGGLLARAGLPAYEALVLISMAALIGLVALSTRLLGSHPARLPWIVALAAAPIISIQLFGVLTELPLAALLIGLVTCLGQWPARGALWGAAACAVGALAVRYAGLLAFPLVAIWLATRWRDLRAAGRLPAALAAGAVATGAAALLLGLNILRSGHASGVSRTGSDGLIALPRELADFGWSVPPALFAGPGARLGPGAAVLVGGGALYAALAALCVRAWLRPATPFSRPLALVTLGYATGMGVLHCLVAFDALHNARTFLPILFPAGLLAAEWLGGRTFLSALAAGGLAAAGTVAAARGISREVGGDVRPAVAPVRARLSPGDTVAINDHAFSLSAYLPQRTTRVFPDHWTGANPERLLVVAAPATNRRGDPGVIPAGWELAVQQAVANGSHRKIIHTPALIVAERVAQALPPGKPALTP